MQEERSETTNDKEEMQADERKKISCNLMNKIIYPSSFRHWPILSLLKPEFTFQICMVMVYDGGNRALIATKDKNVYTLDYNNDDHLKNGGTDIGLYPKKIEELRGIKTFACNSYFVLALDDNEYIYSWKFNEKCISDSRSSLCEMTSTPAIEMLSLYNIVDIACGSYHSLALTRDGQVHSWGDNSYGQVGLYMPYVKTECGYNHEPNQVTLPNMISKLKGKFIVCIACGSKFNMVVTDEGKLYGWGDNKSGQINYQYIINQSEEKYYSYPYEIIVNNKAIVKVACGSEHVLALTDDGKIYAWGKNDKGQVGVNNNLEFSSTTMVDMLECVQDIAAYADLSVAVDNKKNIYVWGECFGQNITTPFLTGLFTIHDAFAYSKMRVMHKPLFVSNSDIEEIVNIFNSLGLRVPVMTLNDPLTSDFVIRVKGHHIYVHKAILQSHSEYFKNKFQSNNELTYSRRLGASVDYDVCKFSYNVYIAFLKYLYTGSIDFPVENILDLVKLADEYGETSFKKKCNQILEEAITTSNVAFFYSKAIEYNVKEFEEFCFQFALCHMKDVLLSEDYLKLDINIRNNFIQRVVKENIFRT